MSTSDNLKFDLLEQNQAQKDVTINEALIQVDALLNNGAIDKDLTTPPTTPNNGDIYIIPTGAASNWAGQDNNIAWFNQIWRFIEPNEGMTIWVNDEDVLYTFDGTTWVANGTPTNNNKIFTILAMGQSNMVGRYAGGDATTNPDVYAWDGSNWVVATLGVAPFYTITANANNIAHSFARKYQQQYGGEVRIILSAQSAQPIAEWVGSGTASTMYADAMAQIAASGTTKIDAILWHQGEQDRDLNGGSAVQYQADLNTLLTQLRAEPTIGKTVPFIAGALLDEGSNSWDDRNDVLTTLNGDADIWTGTASGADLASIGDEIHYNGTSLHVLGSERYFEVYESLPYIKRESSGSNESSIWYQSGTTTPANTTTQDIVRTGKVSINAGITHAALDVDPADTADNATILVGRGSGKPNIKSSDSFMLVDSLGDGSGFAGMHYYTNDNVILANGGGKVGVATNNPNTSLHVEPRTGEPAISVGRASGQPNVKSSDDFMVVDSSGSGNGYAALNFYNSDNVILTYGGGKVGVQTAFPDSFLDVKGENDEVKLKVRASATQTTNLQEWIDNAGITRTKVDANSAFSIGDINTVGIVSDVLTIENNFVIPSSESGSSDDITNILGGQNGMILVLRGAGGQNITVNKNAGGTGALWINSNFTLTSSVDTITLIKNGSVWYELSRSDNG